MKLTKYKLNQGKGKYAKVNAAGFDSIELSIRIYPYTQLTDYSEFYS